MNWDAPGAQQHCFRAASDLQLSGRDPGAQRRPFSRAPVNTAINGLEQTPPNQPRHAPPRVLVPVAPTNPPLLPPLVGLRPVGEVKVRAAPQSSHAKAVLGTLVERLLG